MAFPCPMFFDKESAEQETKKKTKASTPIYPKQTKKHPSPPSAVRKHCRRRIDCPTRACMHVCLFNPDNSPHPLNQCRARSLYSCQPPPFPIHAVPAARHAPVILIHLDSVGHCLSGPLNRHSNLHSHPSSLGTTPNTKPDHAISGRNPTLFKHPSGEMRAANPPA